MGMRAETTVVEATEDLIASASSVGAQHTEATLGGHSPTFLPQTSQWDKGQCPDPQVLPGSHLLKCQKRNQDSISIPPGCCSCLQMTPVCLTLSLPTLCLPEIALFWKYKKYLCNIMEIQVHLVWRLSVSEVWPLQDVLAMTFPSSRMRDFVLLICSFDTALCGC